MRVQVRRVLEYLEMGDDEILNMAECLGMEGLESSDELYRRAWVLAEMTRPVGVLEWTGFWLGQVTPEWSERRGAFPHCNGQAGCWMHLRRAIRWCRCRCGWCRVARLVRRDGKRLCRCEVPRTLEYVDEEWTCPHGETWTYSWNGGWIGG